MPSDNDGLAGPAVSAPSPAGQSPARSGLPARAPSAVPRRGWLEVRWRQLRRAPTPVVRAVGSSTAIAAVLGLAYLGYDIAISRGAVLPGGDLRTLAGVAYVAAVAILGSWTTYLVVPQPGRPGVRSPWSAVLGLLAALPIEYLALVVLFQVLKPLIAP